MWFGPRVQTRYKEADETMDTAIQILAGISALIGLALAVYGLVGLVRGQTYVLHRSSKEADRVTGRVARKYSLYYMLAGGLWAAYALYRLIGRSL